MPKIAIPDPVAVHDTSHPVLGTSLGPYSYRLLGDAAGLSQFGAHLETLPPGSRSAHRHWHEAEDELVYVLSGEVVLIEDTETTLRTGDAAGWPAGHPVGHCLENRSDRDATYLVVGARGTNDVVHYPDAGITLSITGRKRLVFTDRTGTIVHVAEDRE